jgi:hypothetical protein
MFIAATDRIYNLDYYREGTHLPISRAYPSQIIVGLTCCATPQLDPAQSLHISKFYVLTTTFCIGILPLATLRDYFCLVFSDVGLHLHLYSTRIPYHHLDTISEQPLV